MKHNLVDRTRDLKRVNIVIVSLEFNVLRIHPGKLEHHLYTLATGKSKVQLLDIYTPRSSTFEDGLMILYLGFIYTFDRLEYLLGLKET